MQDFLQHQTDNEQLIFHVIAAVISYMHKSWSFSSKIMSSLNMLSFRGRLLQLLHHVHTWRHCTYTLKPCLSIPFNVCNSNLVTRLKMISSVNVSSKEPCGVFDHWFCCRVPEHTHGWCGRRLTLSVSRCSSDLQAANVDVSKAGFKLRLCKYFVRRETPSSHLLDLKDTNNVFWWLPQNVNRNFVYI